MFSFVPISLLAQAIPTPPPEEIVQPQEVRPLPGKLDNIPVFNSNSPELVGKEGILLSTFPPEGKSTPSAHLNFRFNGQFDIFAHHIAKAANPEDLRTLYLGIIVHNPGKKPVTVDILQAASYLSQPDAPFIQLPPIVDNPNSTVYSGPGDRAMNDILRGHRQADFPPQLVIPAGESRMLLNLPIPVRSLEPPLNGRSTLMRLRSDGIVYLASLARYASVDGEGTEKTPSLAEWQEILDRGELSTPRDRIPTPPHPTTDKIIYGRVAGVAVGSIWNTELVDRPNVDFLTIPKPGGAFSYGLSTLPGGLLGTGQNQSANLLVRYPDTAYFAHGNYGVQYSLTLPLYNPTSETQKVTLSLQTPIKENSIQGGLRFFSSSTQPIFFRGTIQIRYNDDEGIPRTRYLHLVQRRGEEGQALVTLNMPPSNRRFVQVDFLYPPDASPPQVLTIKTLENGE